MTASINSSRLSKITRLAECLAVHIEALHSSFKIGGDTQNRGAGLTPVVFRLMMASAAYPKACPIAPQAKTSMMLKPVG